MKILLAADIFPPESGGPATYAVALAYDLQKMGDTITIVSLNPNGDQIPGVTHHISKRNKLMRYIEYFFLLLKHAKNADVIYAMGPVNAGLPAVLVSKFCWKKLVVKVVGDYAWEQSVQRFGVKDLIDDFQKTKYTWKVDLLRSIQKFVVKHATAIITPSQYLKNLVVGWGVEKEKIHVIYNALPLKHAEKNIQKPKDEKWVVSVARLTPWKGMDILIEAVAELAHRYSSIKLKIVGDGPEMKNLQQKVKTLSRENVELLGNTSHSDTLSIIAAADVFVLNSGYEGLSHVLLEALNENVPTLASRVGGNSEVIVPGESGGLFVYNNKEEIKQKISAVLDGYLVLQPEKIHILLEQFHHRIMIESTRKLLQQYAHD